MTLVSSKMDDKQSKTIDLPIKVYNSEGMVYVENFGSYPISGNIRILSMTGVTCFDQFTELFPLEKISVPAISGISVFTFGKDDRHIFSKLLIQ